MGFGRKNSDSGEERFDKNYYFKEMSEGRLRFEEVPDHLFEEVCLMAIQENWEALNRVPVEKRTDKICLAAVRKNWQALQFVPADKLSERICLVAIWQNWQALQLIPADKLTEEVCLAAIQENCEALKLIPVEKLTKEFCLAIIQKNWEAFKLIPEDKLTEEFCLAAIEENWEAIKLIPKEKLTKEICLAVVRKNWEALEWVPIEMLDEAICLVAIEENWEAFKLIPKEKLTKEICLAAIRKNWEALEWVPIEMLDEEICLVAIQENWEALRLIPVEKLNEEMCVAAVWKNWKALQLIPEDRLSDKICLAAVQNNLDAMKYVPDHMQPNIQAFLSNIRHIVVVKENGQDEIEIALSMQVYANKEKRKEKTIFVTPKTLDKLMAKLADANNHHPLELVLLGHHSDRATSLAGMDAPAVVACLEKHPNITTVKLLGCRSAIKADKTVYKAEQDELTREEKGDQLQKVPQTYRLVYMKDKKDKNGNKVFSLLLDENQELKEEEREGKTRLLKELFGKNNQHNPVFVFYEKDNTKYMRMLSRDENGEIEIRENKITDEQYQFYLGKGKPPNILKNNYCGELNKSDEKRDRLMPDLLGLSRYVSKNDPFYPDYKRRHPSERGWEMEWGEGEEYGKYFKANSLTRNILEGVHKNPKISQDLKIVAYYGWLHVDKKEGGFHSTKGRVYNGPISLFKDNIDRKALIDSREENQGTFKKIKIFVRGINHRIQSGKKNPG